MKTILYTTFDCLIKTQSEDFFIAANDNLSIDVGSNPIYVYPTGKSKLLPFTVNTNAQSPFYKIIEKDDKKLIFLLDGLYVQGIDIYHFSHNGQSSKVQISSKEIHFSTKTTKKIISLPAGCDNFKCGNLHHINYATFSNVSGDTLIAFNTKNGKLKTFEAATIKRHENTFTINYDDGRQTTLFVDKDGLKIKDRSSFSNALANPLYVAKNFMEKIKEGEFNSALEHLSSSLKENHTEKSLQDFFGEVSFIFPIDMHNIFALSNGKEKLYSFEIERGKIADICD